MGKQKSPRGDTLTEKASEVSDSPSILPEVGQGTMVTPVSISAFPVGGYSIAEDVVGVNTLMQSPFVVAGRHLNAWEGYNYKSSVQVTGCNPYRSR